MKGLPVKSVFSNVIWIVQDTALFIESSLSSCKATDVYSVIKSLKPLPLWCFKVYGEKTKEHATLTVRNFGAEFPLFSIRDTEQLKGYFWQGH